MQHFLKSARGTAWAEVVAAQLFQQLFAVVDGADSAEGALYAGFGHPALLAFAGGLKTRRGFVVVWFS